MNTNPKARTTDSRRMLQGGAGSFTARARGFLGNEFLLTAEDEDRGRLKMLGLRGAELETGGRKILVDRLADSRYEVAFGDGDVLYASPGEGSGSGLEMQCAGRSYTATVSLFRNQAIVRDETGADVVRISGAATGRSYEVDIVVEDRCALPISALLIYHTAINRRRAYQAMAGKR